jgi:hypothetical protein
VTALAVLAGVVRADVIVLALRVNEALDAAVSGLVALQRRRTRVAGADAVALLANVGGRAKQAVIARAALVGGHRLAEAGRRHTDADVAGIVDVRAAHRFAGARPAGAKIVLGTRVAVVARIVVGVRFTLAVVADVIGTRVAIGAFGV